MIVIRPEKANDLSAIERVQSMAFGRPDEAALVNALSKSGRLMVSLVAVIGDDVVGHIGFSPVTLDQKPCSARAVGLGPLALLPDYQRMGIGPKMMDRGLQTCRQAGAEIAIVLGHSDYYPKAGIHQASLFEIFCEYEVPEEAFMVMELKEGSLANYQGTARYHPAFQEMS